MAEAKKYSQDKPLLIYTDLKVVDENLSVLHESMIRTQSDHANTELVQEMTEKHCYRWSVFNQSCSG